MKQLELQKIKVTYKNKGKKVYKTNKKNIEKKKKLG